MYCLQCRHQIGVRGSGHFHFLVGARVRSRAYDVEDSDNSDDDDDEYSESGDDVGHFLSEVAGTDGGDAKWSDFCGPCCTGANNKDDTTEHLRPERGSLLYQSISIALWGPDEPPSILFASIVNVS